MLATTRRKLAPETDTRRNPSSPSRSHIGIDGCFEHSEVDPWVRTRMSALTGALVSLFCWPVGLPSAIEWDVTALALDHAPFGNARCWCCSCLLWTHSADESRSCLAERAMPDDWQPAASQARSQSPHREVRPGRTRSHIRRGRHDLRAFRPWPDARLRPSPCCRFCSCLWRPPTCTRSPCAMPPRRRPGPGSSACRRWRGRATLGRRGASRRRAPPCRTRHPRRTGRRRWRSPARRRCSATATQCCRHYVGCKSPSSQPSPSPEPGGPSRDRTGWPAPLA